MSGSNLLPLLTKLGCLGLGLTAVIVDRRHGVLDKTVGEGTHLLIPWLQTPYIVNICARPHTLSFSALTKDDHTVNLTLRVLARPELVKLPYIFKTLGVENQECLLPVIGNEVMKTVVAQFYADQLPTKPPYLSPQICNSLRECAEDLHIVLDDVEITHLSYGEKQVVRQEASASNSAKLISDAAAENGLIEQEDFGIQ